MRRRCDAMVALATALVVAVGCSSASHGRHANDDVNVDGGADAVEAGPTIVSCRDAERDGVLCACELLSSSPTALYLLLDASGSMNDGIDGVSKWSVVRGALLDPDGGALRKLGNRLAVGVATFPGSADVCAPGSEVFALTTGGDAAYDRLSDVLGAIVPAGATPIAATTARLGEKLGNLEAIHPNKLTVLLATDGGPNCGAYTCTADRCQYDIEGFATIDGRTCAPPLNCCDPTQVAGGGAWNACDDVESAVAIVTQLASAGIPTVVVGVPGSAAYADDLDALAFAGGAPNPDGPRAYYDASNAASLHTALSSIAGRLAANCDIFLDKPVPDPGVTNVLLDGDTIPMNAANGWSWDGPQKIVLNGIACQRVLDGVGSLQVAVGCKTVTR